MYKEDELGIGDEGGGKFTCVPDCPLFTAFSNQTPRYVPLIVNAVRFHLLDFAYPSNSEFFSTGF